MFVGEMGCWLVLVGSNLYMRMKGKDRRVEYEPLLAEDGIDNDDGEPMGDPSGSVNAANPATTHDHYEEGSAEVKELTGWRTFLLAMPAICDIIGTTLMNTGLLFVVASVSVSPSVKKLNTQLMIPARSTK